MKILYILMALIIATIIPPLMAEGAATVQKIPFTLEVDPANCPEAPSHITGSGRFVMVTRTTTSADGQLHIGIIFSGTGVATDASGGVWTVSDADNALSFNGFEGQPMEMTATEGFHLISHGDGPNIMVQAVFHIKVLADGTVTVDFAKERGASEGCEGFTLAP